MRGFRVSSKTRSGAGTRQRELCDQRWRTRSARRTTADGELILGVLDALLELPAIGRRLTRLDLLELRLGSLELSACALIVDLLHADGVVHQRERAVELDLEEAGPGRELEHLVRVQVDPGRPGLQRRDERCVSCEDTDLTGSAGNDDHLRLAVERGSVGRDERDVELRVRLCHGAYAATASACRAFSTASSIVPTM